MEQSAFDLGITPAEVTPRGPNGGRGGRPKGTKGKYRSALTNAFRDRWHEAFECLMRGVREGDPTATQIYWSRVFPRPARVQVELEGMPAVKTPADARAAMAELLTRALGGELPADHAVDLVRLLAAFLQASTVHAIDPGASSEEEETSARERLIARLARVVEERGQSAEPPPADGLYNPTPPAAAEVDISSDELKAQVAEAVREALRERGEA